MASIFNSIFLLLIAALSPLNIGDAAPSINGNRWSKGEAPVFDNQFTIVELWSPSCGNCKAQIPHLTEIQKKYGDRILIMALTKAPTEVIQDFIRTNGDQIEYVIIKPTEEVWDSYSAGLPGVPYAFLINRDGIIIWKGHPSSIDDFLAKTMEENTNIDQLSSGKR